MNTESNCKKSCAGVYALAAAGTFLVMGSLVWLMRSYTQPPSLAEVRGTERRKIRDDLRALNQPLLDNYAWQDPVKEIVRVPVEQAKDLILQEWQDPAKGYALLTNRAAKAFAPAPPPVNKYK
jgi:hypothetical protein